MKNAIQCRNSEESSKSSIIHGFVYLNVSKREHSTNAMRVNQVDLDMIGKGECCLPGDRAYRWEPACRILLGNKSRLQYRLDSEAFAMVIGLWRHTNNWKTCKKSDLKDSRFYSEDLYEKWTIRFSIIVRFAFWEFSRSSIESTIRKEAAQWLKTESTTK